LDLLRPAAPVATPKDGFYSQYISVSFQETGATLYVTTDGSYPSVQDEPYRQPIALSSGESLIYAVAVADNGLVSPLSIFGYTIGGVVEIVKFNDEAIETAVRKQLELDDTTEIFTNDLWSITEFTIPAEAVNCEVISQFSYLRKLTVQAPQFEDFSFLTSLGHLEELTISGSVLSAKVLEYIGNLPNLVRLSLTDCGISNISALSNATKLTYLNLDQNSVQDVEPLSSLSALQTLSLRHNAMTNLEALARLAGLRSLDIAYNSVASTAPLAGCNQLRTLDISGNALRSLEGIEMLTGLTSLIASSNNLVEVTEIVSCTGLTYLDISSNSILDISGFTALIKLETFLFSNNEISALPAWNKDLPLVRIDGSYNNLKDLKALSGISTLNYVYMDHNKKLSTIEPLKTCNMLVQINVFGTKVSKVDWFLDHDIVVNYDPT
jgi:internalin A